MKRFFRLKYALFAFSFLGGFLLGEQIGISWEKNLIGSFLGYGGCPNCQDSWWWKHDGSIPLETRQDTLSAPETPGFSVFITLSLMVCTECLAHPEALDPGRIEQELLAHGWGVGKAAEARRAVGRYRLRSLQKSAPGNSVMM